MSQSSAPIQKAAVIDVGSNTIKILAGEKTPTGLSILFDQTAECRISAGMYSDPPQFTANSMEAASLAIRDLLEQVKHLDLDKVEILSTSAVRDAENREVFANLVTEKTGHPLLILSGTEEAQGIANGIAQEPSIDAKAPYSISDLGGGSLEWIFRNEGKIEHITSMQLGAVRLMNQYVPDPMSPLTDEAKQSIRSHCLASYREFLPQTALPSGSSHWGTGGAFTITRLLLATEKGIPLRQQSQTIPLAEIQRIESILSSLPLEERQTYPGLPATRADILPVALTIIQALAEFTGAHAFHHSFCNLRMGRLAALLHQP